MMTINALFTLLSATLTITAKGFSAPTNYFPTTSRTSASSPSGLWGIRCEDKYYQLEEMEDSDSCTTELFLCEDRTVAFGKTDGPPFDEAEGYWQVTPGTNDFTMEITKTFSSGQEFRDMGEFSFQVKRTFVGEMTMVGASVGITGVTHDAFEGQDKEIGYFNMIDATDERLNKGQ